MVFLRQLRVKKVQLKNRVAILCFTAKPKSTPIEKILLSRAER